METKDFKRTKGITLISLVVAIVVLLILAGISISLVIGDNGILTQSSSSVVTNREAKAKEEVQLAWSSAETKYYTDWAKNTSVNKDEYFGDEVLLTGYVTDTGTVESSVKNSDGQTWTVKYRAKDQNQLYTFIIDEIGNIVTKNGEILLSKTITKLQKNDEETLEVILDGIEVNITWESSAPEIVSVTSSGTNATIKALADSGSAVIKAKIAGTIYETTCLVTIFREITSISVENITIEEGETHQIVVSTTPTGQNLENISYTYSSSNTSKVTVNEAGIVTGIAAGNSIITIRGTGEDSGKNVETTCTVNVELAPLHIGSTVIYKPTGKYNWDEYYASDDKNSINKLQTVAVGSVSTGYTDVSVTRWKVLKIDKQKVQLVPASVNPVGGVGLWAASGYNNAVNLLDEACSSLYGNSSKGITARSIDMTDIEEALNAAGVDDDNDGILDWVKERTDYTYDGTKYNHKVENAYSTKYSNYPLIYSQEEKSVINGIEKSDGLGVSDGLTEYSEKNLIGRTDSGATYGRKQASSIQPYQTAYYFNNTKFSNYLGTTYSAILLPRGTATHYWIASRCVRVYRNYCGFYVRIVNSGDLGYSSLEFSTKTKPDASGSGGLPLFPVVNVDFASITAGIDEYEIQ